MTDIKNETDPKIWGAVSINLVLQFSYALTALFLARIFLIGPLAVLLAFVFLPKAAFGCIKLVLLNHDSELHKGKHLNERTLFPLILLFLGSGLSLIICFASLYRMSGIARNVGSAHTVYDCWSTVYFSATTWTTVGYGDFIPYHTSSELVAIIEMFCGILFNALLTSGIFALFTKLSPFMAATQPKGASELE